MGSARRLHTMIRPGLRRTRVLKATGGPASSRDSVVGRDSTAGTARRRSRRASCNAHRLRWALSTQAQRARRPRACGYVKSTMPRPPVPTALDATSSTTTVIPVRYERDAAGWWWGLVDASRVRGTSYAHARYCVRMSIARAVLLLPSEELERPLLGQLELALADAGIVLDEQLDLPRATRGLVTRATAAIDRARALASEAIAQLTADGHDAADIALLLGLPVEQIENER